MRLEPDEIAALAEALAPRVAASLAAYVDARPQWAMSVAEAPSRAKVEPHVICDAVATGRLPVRETRPADQDQEG